MLAIGTVIEKNENTVKVESTRTSACEFCHNCEAKGFCHPEPMFGNQTQKVIIDAQNEIGAKVGDVVEVSSSTKSTLFVSVVVYLIPAILAIFSFLAFDTLLNEAVLAMFSVLIFCLSFFVSVKVMNLYVKKNLTAVAVRIVEESESRIERE